MSRTLHNGNIPDLLVSFDIGSSLDIGFCSGADQDELAPNTLSSTLDQQVDTEGPVHRVHKDVELVQTPDWRTHGFPNGEQEAYL